MAGVAQVADVDAAGCFNGRFRQWRGTAPDPLPPVAPSKLQRQVSKWSCRPERFLTDRGSAFSYFRTNVVRRQQCVGLLTLWGQVAARPLPIMEVEPVVNMARVCKERKMRFQTEVLKL
ncbi:MAG: hypothetical protein HY018_02310 [Hydrogenophilales bacterium]|nr:hypothetical protein [Hydrogenophilales bacterium]